MGNSVSSIKNINFEDMLSFIERPGINENTIIIKKFTRLL